MSKNASFARAGLTVLLLLLALWQLEADMSCSDVLSDVSPCLGFLQGDEDHPSGDCCDGVSSLVTAAAATADRQAACECLKSAVGQVSVDTSAAQALPADCGVSLPYTISPDVDCSHLEIVRTFLALIVLSSIGFSAYYNSRYARRWPGYAAFGAGWAVGTVGLVLCAKQQSAPKMYGVPLMPWLPAASVATNLFLIGSLGSMVYLRFGICTVAMLVCYVLRRARHVAHYGEGTTAAADAAADSVEQGKIVPLSTPPA